MDAGALIRELADYVGFSEKDRKRLADALPLIESDIPAMADVFYASIERNSAANAFLTGSGVPIDRLKQTLQEWLRTLFTGARDPAYGESRLRIGERHVQLGLEQRYVLGAMNVVRSFVMERLKDPKDVDSFNRALDLDMNLICESYHTRSLEEKELEKRQVEEKLEDFLDRSPVLVVGIDREGRTTLFNRAFEEASGWKRSEVIGKEYGPMFLPERDRARVESIVRSISEGGALDPVENPILTRGGKERLVRWYPTVTRDAEGEIREVVGIGHDITELMLLQRQAAEGEKMAALGVLAAGIAHEVGNPLNSILAVTQNLQRKIKEESVRGDLSIVAEQVTRASRTLQQMTQLARPTRKAMEELRLNRVVQASLDLIRFDPRARGMEIATDLARDLPTTWAHRDELSQVFLNLFLNAVDAMEGTEGRLVVRTTRVSDRIRIDVEDNGIGISPEDQKNLFEAFTTTKPAGKGTGLGLWVCRRIAQEHGGGITVESTKGKGTTFRVHLPIRSHPL